MALPKINGDDGRLEGVPSGCWEVDPAKEERILWVALYLTSQDAPMTRKEGNEGARGEGGAFARRQ